LTASFDDKRLVVSYPSLNKMIARRRTPGDLARTLFDVNATASQIAVVPSGGATGKRGPVGMPLNGRPEPRYAGNAISTRCSV